MARLNSSAPQKDQQGAFQLVCIHNIRMPTEKAHGVQISKMCEAFAVAGASVSLLLPTRKNAIQTDVFSYYRVAQTFTVRFLKCVDAIAFFSRWPRLGFYGQALSFLWRLRQEEIPPQSVILTRNPEIAWWFGYRGYTVFFDAHRFSTRQQALLSFLLKRVTGIIANSRGTKEAFERAGFSAVLAAPNAVDLTQFSVPLLTDRKMFGLPLGRIAMYVGHLYGWKGVDTVIAAARMASQTDLFFVFVGGTEEDVARYRAETKEMPNVLFLGHRIRQDIPQLMAHASVLLLPNVPVSQESVAYTSPLKLFEYMASGIPIVASNLPSLREVLHEQNSILVQPANPKALLEGIMIALRPEAQARSLRAKEEVKQYTWDERAKKILHFMNMYVRNHR